ncbi:MAG: hypothetical protein RR444_10445 [Oscillospiraceae bacterium]
MTEIDELEKIKEAKAEADYWHNKYQELYSSLEDNKETKYRSDNYISEKEYFDMFKTLKLSAIIGIIIAVSVTMYFSITVNDPNVANYDFSHILLLAFIVTPILVVFTYFSYSFVEFLINPKNGSPRLFWILLIAVPLIFIFFMWAKTLK